MQRPHDAQRGAPLDAGQAAGVAVGVQAQRRVAAQRLQQRRRPARASARLVRTSSSASSTAAATTASLPSRRGEHATAPPTSGSPPSAEPRRCARPRRARTPRPSPSPLGLLRGQRDAEPAGHADRRRAPHGQPLDGVDHRVDVADLQPRTTRRGSRVWSIRTTWSPRHSMVRIAEDRRIHDVPHRPDPFALAARAADALADRTGAARHDVAVVLGSGWGRCADVLGAGPTIAVADLPGFPAAVGGRPRRRGALDRRRRPRGRSSSSAGSTSTRATTPSRRRPRRARRRRGRLPHGRPDQRRRLAAHGVADRPAGADQRPHQPDRPLAADRCQPAGAVRLPLRRPHRPLQRAAAAVARPVDPDAARGCVPRPPRSALRDAGRDPHGRDRSAPTSSACPRCSRRSPPATSGWRCSASRWPPTWPPASARCPSTPPTSSPPATQPPDASAAPPRDPRGRAWCTE